MFERIKTHKKKVIFGLVTVIGVAVGIPTETLLTVVTPLIDFLDFLNPEIGAI